MERHTDGEVGKYGGGVVFRSAGLLPLSSAAEMIDPMTDADEGTATSVSRIGGGQCSTRIQE